MHPAREFRPCCFRQGLSAGGRPQAGACAPVREPFVDSAVDGPAGIERADNSPLLAAGPSDVVVESITILVVDECGPARPRGGERYRADRGKRLTGGARAVVGFGIRGAGRGATAHQAEVAAGLIAERYAVVPGCVSG